ncbi:type 4a pilus biogenesis protein PilO [Pseudogemmatithrix spongiicola]|uniref:Type 4a pilus biogenesis protein PilO n=1 Tax=Pseudogemmatithrix spongiicola TaxID=3062599 RepID=A0AA49Q8N5_9BACT|nr:type 4a pilus biogenesis protein PilO [Gemmatimonadaceae bacterium 'strain 138']WKW15944.1 type 4a pilus biogenesis protein PilO [Gemmatimonadaceae bacterium 'strain 318']
MAGMPTNQRDQVMLVVGIVGILGAAAYWNFVYTPKAETLATQEARLEKLDQTNNRAKAMLARGTVEQMREEAKVLSDNLALIRTLIPAGNEVPALLDQILAAARRVGLEQDSFVPGAVVRGETFDTYRYRFSFNGTYHQIAEMLTAVGSLRRIMAPVGVSLTPAPQGSSRLRVASGQQVLSANFDIQTYVLRAADAEDGGTP